MGLTAASDAVRAAMCTVGRRGRAMSRAEMGPGWDRKEANIASDIPSKSVSAGYGSLLTGFNHFHEPIIVATFASGYGRIK
jgi:hypothetical protein